MNHSSSIGMTYRKSPAILIWLCVGCMIPPTGCHASQPETPRDSETTTSSSITVLIELADSTEILADNELIQFMGRIDYTNPKSPTFAFSGVTIHVRIEGTDLQMRLHDNGSEDK